MGLSGNKESTARNQVQSLPEVSNVPNCRVCSGFPYLESQLWFWVDTFLDPSGSGLSYLWLSSGRLLGL